MAGRIRQDDVEAVKERTDLVKLVSQYLALRKAVSVLPLLFFWQIEI